MESNVSLNFITTTASSALSVSRVSISAFLIIITLLTIVGNAVVLAAFANDKGIRTTFTTYIANLAVTDLSVGLFAMTFYTFDVMLGYWPFGEFLCGMWIFFDYGMTFASVFTLVAISVDRFWSVTWHVHYRAKNNKRKVVISLVIVWLAVLVIWLPPCIYDRVKWSEPGVCKWEPSNNREFVILVAIIGHHLPCVALLFCYIRVFTTMQKRRRGVIPHGNNSMNNAPGPSIVSPEYNRHLKPQVYLSDTTNVCRAGPPSDEISEGVSFVTCHVDAANQEPVRHVRKIQTTSSIDREKKIFVTLSYVIFSYLICWVPFHVVFDVSAVNPDLVPELVYTITFWLTYLNSTINPILYAYSSKEFRLAFIKAIKCTYYRR